VHRLTRHLRGLLVAIATLALSAGVVLAAHPAGGHQAAATGVSPATEVTDPTVGADEDEDAPDVDEDEDAEAPEVGDDEDADEDEDSEAPEADQGVGGGSQAGSQERAQNHGWFVSAAAKGATPATSATHGEFVSAIAQSDLGKPAAANAAKAGKAKAPKAGNH
jgi:hypothetical protein